MQLSKHLPDIDIILISRNITLEEKLTLSISLKNNEFNGTIVYFLLYCEIVFIDCSESLVTL